MLPFLFLKHNKNKNIIVFINLRCLRLETSEQRLWRKTAYFELRYLKINHSTPLANVRETIITGEREYSFMLPRRRPPKNVIHQLNKKLKIIIFCFPSLFSIFFFSPLI